MRGELRHQTFALSIARSFTRRLPPSVQREDIEQAALIGLFEWLRAHPDEAQTGWRWGLATRIRGSILDELRRQDWLPRRRPDRNSVTGLCVVHCDDVDPRWQELWGRQEESPEAALERKQEGERLAGAPLSPGDAEVIRLHYYRGKLHREIAAIMGSSAPRISQRHDRALRVLRAHLEGDEMVLREARHQLKRALAAGASARRAVHASGPRLGGPSAGTEEPSEEEEDRPVMSTLPEEGINLRVELVRYQDWMIEQALIRTQGNKSQAAKLLGLKRTTLVMMLTTKGRLLPSAELEAAPGAIDGDGEPPTTVRRREETAVPRVGDVDVRNIGHIAQGVEMISAAAIRRYAADGLTRRQIANRLGCNPYIVDRVLREHLQRQVVALDEQGIAPSAIAQQLGCSLADVRSALSETPVRRAAE